MFYFFFILELFVWCIVCLAISVSLTLYVKKKSWINKEKHFYSLVIFIFIITFSGHSWYDIFLHYYQKRSLPELCEEYAGYHPYRPIQISSLINLNNSLYDYLPVEGVSFVEWEKTSNLGAKRLERFELGKYRFSYYSEGSPECGLLNYFDPEAEKEIGLFKMRYQPNGFKIKDTAGKCVGVKFITSFEARYDFKRGSLEKVKMRFGSDAKISKTNLINRISGEVISSFQEVSLSTPRPFYKYSKTAKVFNADLLIKGCSPFETAKKYEFYPSSKISNISLYIRRGFFDFNE